MCLVYIDDVIVLLKNTEEHFYHLKHVLYLLHEEVLKLKLFFLQLIIE